MITQKIEKLFIDTKTGNTVSPDYTPLVIEPLTIEQRLDRELDSGSFDFIRRDTDCTDDIDAPLSHYRVTLSDGVSAPISYNFIGKDTRSILRGKFGDGTSEDTAIMFRHSVMLTEPTKLLEGDLIDGFAVTQPEENGSATSVTQEMTFAGFDRTETVSGMNYGYKMVKCEYAIKSASINIQSVGGSYFYSDVEFTVGDDFFYVVIGYTSRPGYIQLYYTYEKLFQSQSLKEVIDRFLEVSPMRKSSGESQTFFVSSDAHVELVLKNTVAPQFHWSPQSTVFECLLDLGNVIDAIPRLVADANGEYNQITFDFVNEQVGEVDDLIDDNTRDYFSEFDDSQYNSQLRSVVENVKKD